MSDFKGKGEISPESIIYHLAIDYEVHAAKMLKENVHCMSKKKTLNNTKIH